MEQGRVLANFRLAAKHLLRGANESHSGVERTPERYANAMAYLLRGYEMDPKSFIVEFDNVKSSSMIVVQDVDVFSFCEHHLLPFTGKAAIGYIPNKDTQKVLGISKLARILDCFACRFQIQERIGEQYCDFVMEHLKPDGVIVVIDAQHFCMTERGVHKKNALTSTAAIRGAFNDPSTRQEFYDIVAPSRRVTH